jgi:hypothetical protein
MSDGQGSVRCLERPAVDLLNSANADVLLVAASGRQIDTPISPLPSRISKVGRESDHGHSTATAATSSAAPGRRYF